MSDDPRFITDEDFNRDIVTGVLRRLPTIDLIRVQDADLSGREDPDILHWAASHGRIILTHDTRTMIGFAKARVAGSERMPGMIVVRQEVPVRVAIEELTMIALCSGAGEWDNQIRFIPL